jgi:hypothetical protein
MPVAQFRKRAVVIEAIQWTGDNFEELRAFAGPDVELLPYLDPPGPDKISIRTMANGWVPSPVGEWLMKGVSGEFYPCADSVFRASYDAATETTETDRPATWVAKMADWLDDLIIVEVDEDGDLLIDIRENNSTPNEATAILDPDGAVQLRDLLNRYLAERR